MSQEVSRASLPKESILMMMIYDVARALLLSVVTSVEGDLRRRRADALVLKY
jgi:hypothetical protein